MTVNMYAFWDAHYRIEDHELRVMIADTFLSMLDVRGWDRKRLTTPICRHPMTRRKEWGKISIIEILSDFIMRPVQVEERRESYPVKNADAEYYNRRNREKFETSLDAFEESGGQVDSVRGVYTPNDSPKEEREERRLSEEYLKFVNGETPGVFTVNISTGEKTVHSASNIDKSVNI